jgi:hypothetical protein
MGDADGGPQNARKFLTINADTRHVFTLLIND